MTAQDGNPTTIGGLPLDPDPLTGDEWFPFDLTTSGPTYRAQLSALITLLPALTYVPLTRQVLTTASLQGGGALSADLTLSLQGDSASPGNGKYYGTDGSGLKGFHDLSILSVPASSITGVLAVANGGTGTASPGLIAGSGIIITGTWPNQTITTSVSGGTVTSVATGTGLTGGPVTTSGTISLANTAVTPGAYTSMNATVDAQGRITAASNGSAGTVTSVATGTGLTGGPVTSTGTIALANTAVTPGAYTSANITVDAQGRITAAASGGGGSVSSISQGTGMHFSTTPITSTGTINLADTAVTPGSYTNASITVDQQGRLTAASSGTGASFGGARVRKTSDQLITGPGSGALTWQAADYDTSSYWSAGASTRFTVPSGVSYVVLRAGIEMKNTAANTQLLFMQKNGTNFQGQAQFEAVASGVSATPVQNFTMSCGPEPVSPGDYFEVFALTQVGIQINTAFDTWFSIQAVG